MAKKAIRTTSNIAGEIRTAMDTLFNEHAAYIEKGNKSAAVRARTATKTLTALMKEYRAVSIAETK